ncbi:MAG: hypothetical protein QOF61_1129, partial [Acidobacteriota bacterium]|nr:hypothetical protein [Acidobacteriota bacterium]
AEQVAVETAAKSNILIRSVTPLAARIQAPPLMEVVYGDIVRIDTGARNVTLQGFVIAGPLPDYLFCAVQIRSGVRVRGGASANILSNHITEIRSASPLLRGCQNGIAVAVGRRFEVGGPQVGQALILGNQIDKYQKGGIYVDNTGSGALIAGNTVQGEGLTNVIAQNGIQISREASAEVRANRIFDHAYVAPVQPCVPFATCVTATAVLLFENVRATADDNELRRNQDGFGLYTLPGNVNVSNNSIIGGIPPNPSLGTPTLGDGIFADVDTALNRIRSNFLRRNVEHDCHDDSVGPNNPPAFVANFWINNDGQTQNRPGLCRERRGGDDDRDDDRGDDRKDDARNHDGDNRAGVNERGASRLNVKRASPLDDN